MGETSVKEKNIRGLPLAGFGDVSRRDVSIYLFGESKKWFRAGCIRGKRGTLHAKTSLVSAFGGITQLTARGPFNVPLSRRNRGSPQSILENILEPCHATPLTLFSLHNISYQT